MAKKKEPKVVEVDETLIDVDAAPTTPTPKPKAKTVAVKSATAADGSMDVLPADVKKLDELSSQTTVLKVQDVASAGTFSVSGMDMQMNGYFRKGMTILETLSGDLYVLEADQSDRTIIGNLTNLVSAGIITKLK